MTTTVLRLAALLATTTLIAASAGCASGGSTGAQSEQRPSLTSSVEEPSSASNEDAMPQRRPEEIAEWARDLPVYATGPVAFVDDEPIEAADFNEAIKRRFGDRETVRRVLVKMFKKRTMDQLIEQHLIVRELDAHGIEVTEAEVDDGLEELRDGFDSDESFDDFLDVAGISKEDLRGEVRKAERLRNYLQKNYDVDVTDAEVRNEYDKNPERWEHARRIKARQILVEPANENEAARLEARDEALEIYKMVEAEPDRFADFAREHSDGPAAPRGGDMGYFPRRSMVDAFSDVAFSMKPGQISKPVETQFGWHIIKVEDVEPAGKTPFSEAEADIRRQLEEANLRDAMKEMIAKLRESAAIERQPENIETNEDAITESSGSTPPAQSP